jgi:hypothetical protein
MRCETSFRTGVAGHVSEGIVDGLEVVHIEHENSHGGMGAQSALDFGAQQVEQGAAVRQAGEHIVGGLVAQLFLRDEQVVLQRENIGEGLAFFLMGGLGLQAERVSFLELGADDACLPADAAAKNDVPCHNHRHNGEEKRGEDKGIAGRPPGRALQDRDCSRGLQQDLQSLRGFARSDLD